MKRAFIILIISALISGCAIKKTFCPSERAYFLGPEGRVMIMEKGFFDTKKGHWLTEDEYNERVKTWKKRYGY